jgi:hypothetical protein
MKKMETRNHCQGTGLNKWFLGFQNRFTDFGNREEGLPMRATACKIAMQWGIEKVAFLV